MTTTRAPIGCLLLHGFTSSLATVDGLAPLLAEGGIPYRMPLLRGHGATPDRLRGVTWRDWYADASAALDDLLAECDRAVVTGLSMGGLVALHLAAERAGQLAGVVAIAPALKLSGGPRDQIRLLLAAVVNGMVAVDARKAYVNVTRAAVSTNYPVAPARAILSLVTYQRVVRRLLPEVTLPLLLVYTPRDRVVEPATAGLIYESVRTAPADKRLVAFSESGHELLLDQQREEVFATILAFLDDLRAAPARTAAVPASHDEARP